MLIDAMLCTLQDLSIKCLAMKMWWGKKKRGGWASSSRLRHLVSAHFYLATFHLRLWMSTGSDMRETLGHFDRPIIAASWWLVWTSRRLVNVLHLVLLRDEVLYAHQKLLLDAVGHQGPPLGRDLLHEVLVLHVETLKRASHDENVFFF